MCTAEMNIIMHAQQQTFFHSYVPWNLHEEIKGQFNFKGILDIA